MPNNNNNMDKLKPGKISTKRAYEISDSLMDKSNRLKAAAYDQRMIGKGTIKNKVADKQVSTFAFPTFHKPSSRGPATLSGNDRLKIADNLQKQASADSAKSVLLKNRADAAVAKAKAAAGRDVPLPSSEGIMSTISNKLSQLFK